jgi:hypothetical protein
MIAEMIIQLPYSIAVPDNMTFSLKEFQVEGYKIVFYPTNEMQGCCVCRRPRYSKDRWSKCVLC